MSFSISVILLYFQLLSASNTLALLESAKKHERAGDIEKALISYEKVLEKDPVNIVAVNRLGLLYIAKGLYQRAQERYSTITKINPKLSTAWYILGFAYRKNGRCPKSIMAFEKYMELVPQDPDPLYSYAACLETMGKLKKSQIVYQRYILREKKSSEKVWVKKAKKALIRLGIRLGSTGKAKIGNKKYGMMMYKRAVGLYKTGKKNDAFSLIIKGLAYDPGNMTLLNGLSSLTLELKRCSVSLQFLKRGLYFHAKSKPILYSIAWCQRSEGQYTRAIAIYKTYLGYYPNDTDVIFGLAETYRYANLPTDARFYYLRYLAIEKRPAQKSWRKKAKYYAVQMLSKLNNKQPVKTKKPKVMVDSALLKIVKLIKNNKYALALLKIGILSKKRPRHARVIVLKAEIRISQFLLNDAERLVKLANQLKKDLPAVHRLMGTIFIKKRLKKQAIVQFKKYLLLAPGDPYEKDNIIKIKAIMKILTTPTE
jgi:tetratricopeptide (TPR) repeat protein